MKKRFFLLSATVVVGLALALLTKPTQVSADEGDACISIFACSSVPGSPMYYNDLFEGSFLICCGCADETRGVRRGWFPN